MTLRALSLILALGATAPAHAANVFAEDFNYGPTTVLNASSSVFGGNWTITDGTVDYLAGGSSFGELCAGFPSCVDLDGSTMNAGVFATTQVFGPGRYRIAFSIVGNQRIDTPDEVTISLGDFSHTFTIGRNEFLWGGAPVFAGVFDDILVTTAGVLSFANAGGDNIGAVLKNVYVDTLAPVPLPAGGLMLAGGLGLLALGRRRRG